MKEKEKSSNSRGVGFAGLLTIAFIILKLCGVISWSWIWVLSPLWIGITIPIIILICMIIRIKKCKRRPKE